MDELDPFLAHFLPGGSNEVVELRRTISRLNRRYKNPPRMARAVLLAGETGVGKNHVARVIAGHLAWLHDPGCWQPPGGTAKTKSILQVTAESFADVPLPNLPNQLIESELFGHVKGAFTDAKADKDGYFAMKHITDLLLDEIGEADPSLQAKLLQVLSTRTFRRVGAPDEECTTEARIFLATNRNLADMVKRGQFRRDLFWRIQHLVITLPPLRDQRERIPVLAKAIVSEIQREHDIAPSTMPTLSDADIAWAKQQTWPGNIRELERLLWRWIYEEGILALSEVQRFYPAENLEDERVDSIKEVLRAQITEALATNARLAVSVGEYCKDLSHAAQRALYELKDELRLDHNALETLFGGGAKAAKQISQSGRRSRP